jgi:hypothetical protein
VDSDNSLTPELEHRDSALAQRINDIDAELDRLRQLRPTLFGHFLRALVMVGILLVAWYRIVFDGYGDVLLYLMIGGVGVWCATIVTEVLEHRQRQLRLERELNSLLAKPASRLSPQRAVRPGSHGGTDEQ